MNFGLCETNLISACYLPDFPSIFFASRSPRNFSLELAFARGRAAPKPSSSRPRQISKSDNWNEALTKGLLIKYRFIVRSRCSSVTRGDRRVRAILWSAPREINRVSLARSGSVFHCGYSACIYICIRKHTYPYINIYSHVWCVRPGRKIANQGA